MANGFAQVSALTRLLGAASASQRFGIGLEAEREELGEREAARGRGERFVRGQRRGGLAGGLFGTLLGGALAPLSGGLSLLIPALLAGGGSFLGQKLFTRGARREIEPGTFQVERGRERERLFEEETEESILANALLAGATSFRAETFFPGISKRAFTAGRGLLTRGGAPRSPTELSDLLSFIGGR